MVYLNRAESKYAGKFAVASSGHVEVVAVEHTTVTTVKMVRGPPVQRWYLVIACGTGKDTWFGKLATTAAVARAVKARVDSRP